jgi:hypothetical protein
LPRFLALGSAMCLPCVCSQGCVFRNGSDRHRRSSGINPMKGLGHPPRLGLPA